MPELRVPRRFALLIASLCTCLVPPTAIGQDPAKTHTPRPHAAAVHGRLSRFQGLRVLKLWGTPRQRGFAQGRLIGREIVGLLDRYLSDGGAGGAEIYESQVLPATRLMLISPEHEQELRGMLAGIEAAQIAATQPTGSSTGKRTALVPALKRGLRYEDLVAINCIPDFGTAGCSSFAAWGALTADGQTLAARNLDWHRTPALDGTQIVIVRAGDAKTHSLGWISVTWPGYIGCLTGMNAEGVCVAMHDVHSAPPSIPLGFTPRGLALRAVIEAAHADTAVADAVAVLRMRLALVGNNVFMAMPHRGSAGSVVLEYDGRLSQEGGVTVRRGPGKCPVAAGRLPDDALDKAGPNAGSADANWQVCTNHYRQRSRAEGCQRYDRLRQQLEAICRDHQKLGVPDAWRLLDSVAQADSTGGGLMTYQSVVFEPDRGRLQVAFSHGDQPASRRPAVTLLVKAWLE